MKVRNDFVTNSSSSSFIIARKPFEFDEIGLEKYPILRCVDDLISTVFFSKGGDFDTEVGYEAHTVSELNKYFIDTYGYGVKSIEEMCEIDEWYKESYFKSLDAISRGCSVIFKDIGYDDELIGDIIKQLVKMDIGIELLASDE